MANTHGAPMPRKRPKPKSPAQIAAEKRAQAFAAVNLDPSTANLTSASDIDAERAQRAKDGHRGNLERARRLDAFSALADSLTPSQRAAAHQLTADLVTMMGLHDRGRGLERIDGSAIGGRTDAMLAARDRVKAVMARMGDRDAWLLSELIVPSPVCRLCTTWRAVVAHVTGEDNPHAQAAAVRSALANAVAAYGPMLIAA